MKCTCVKLSVRLGVSAPVNAVFVVVGVFVLFCLFLDVLGGCCLLVCFCCFCV